MRRYNCGLYYLDPNSYLMFTPFIKLDRTRNMMLGAWCHAGENPWYTWFAEFRVALIWWEVAVGIRYKKVY